MQRSLFYPLFAVLLLTACGDKNGAGNEQTTPVDTTAAELPQPPASADAGGSEAATATTDGASYRPDTARLYYRGGYDKKKSYIVISKRDLRLYVYADVAGEPRLLAHYPVCLSRNKGQKERKGDNRTPESPEGKPFKIQQIQDASSWCHDFGDGRGSIKAYGAWFLRLETPGHSGIGIHGSTNNENSVPGRASEGCIRLRDQDIIHLKETFAYVGMPVTIQAEGAAHLPFMDKARKDNPSPVSYTTHGASTTEPAIQPPTSKPTTKPVKEEPLQIADPGKEYHAR